MPSVMMLMMSKLSSSMLLFFDEVVEVDGEVGYRSDKEGLFWGMAPP